MSGRQPPHDLGAFSILAGPPQQAPKIGRHAVGEQPGGSAFGHRFEHPFAGQVVLLLVEERPALHGTMEHVVEKIARTLAYSSRHSPRIAERPRASVKDHSRDNPPGKML